MNQARTDERRQRQLTLTYQRGSFLKGRQRFKVLVQVVSFEEGLEEEYDCLTQRGIGAFTDYIY